MLWDFKYCSVVSPYLSDYDSAPANDFTKKIPLIFRDIETKYSEKAMQCWIAAGMYGVTLILVFWQNKYNTATVF
ncbi:unnamed protein product [Strongylus vulgaris]|uniref:Uncharacterized protein n=1 Tax=Strongylus vulgaris TaxID=40348 RepID=A0A3P7LGJ6_STRVU|nr:unnamed protein product [Strongylus vulgaris]